MDEATQVRPRFAGIHNFLGARAPLAGRNGEATARSSALVRTQVTEVALAYQFGISYDTYNLVATGRSRLRSHQSGLIKFTDFLHAIGVMKSKPNSWKNRSSPVRGEPGS